MRRYSASAIGKAPPDNIQRGLRMADELKGKKIAFLAADMFEEVELAEPWKALEEAGAELELVSLEDGEVQGFKHYDKAGSFKVDKTVEEANASDYDGLVLPGGRRQSRQPAPGRECGQLRPRLLRARQAGRRDLPCAVDAHRGRRRARPDADVLPVPADGHPECGRELG